MNLVNQLKYSFYVIFHPFDGFWDLKHEKKGSKKSAAVILLAVIIVYILVRQFTGYILNNNSKEELNLFSEIFSVLLPFFLWCISNWGVTTLMDGKGTFTDIGITTAYSLIPIIIINIPMILLSNIITFEEAELYFVLNGISLIWAAFLMFTGIMTIHQYNVKKTVLTFIIAIAGMGGMLFLGLLFFGLLQELINFIYVFYVEMTLRLH